MPSNCLEVGAVPARDSPMWTYRDLEEGEIADDQSHPLSLRPSNRRANKPRRSCKRKHRPLSAVRGAAKSPGQTEKIKVNIKSSDQPPSKSKRKNRRRKRRRQEIRSSGQKPLSAVAVGERNNDDYIEIVDPPSCPSPPIITLEDSEDELVSAIMSASSPPVACPGANGISKSEPALGDFVSDLEIVSDAEMDRSIAEGASADCDVQFEDLSSDEIDVFADADDEELELRLLALQSLMTSRSSLLLPAAEANLKEVNGVVADQGCAESDVHQLVTAASCTADKPAEEGSSNSWPVSSSLPKPLSTATSPIRHSPDSEKILPRRRRLSSLSRERDDIVRKQRSRHDRWSRIREVNKIDVSERSRDVAADVSPMTEVSRPKTYSEQYRVFMETINTSRTAVRKDDCDCAESLGGDSSSVVEHSAQSRHCDTGMEVAGASQGSVASPLFTTSSPVPPLSSRSPDTTVDSGAWRVQQVSAVSASVVEGLTPVSSGQSVSPAMPAGYREDVVDEDDDDEDEDILRAQLLISMSQRSAAPDNLNSAIPRPPSKQQPPSPVSSSIATTSSQSSLKAVSALPQRSVAAASIGGSKSFVISVGGGRSGVCDDSDSDSDSGRSVAAALDSRHTAFYDQLESFLWRARAESAPITASAIDDLTAKSILPVVSREALSTVTPSVSQVSSVTGKAAPTLLSTVPASKSTARPVSRATGVVTSKPPRVSASTAIISSIAAAPRPAPVLSTTNARKTVFSATSVNNASGRLVSARKPVNTKQVQSSGKKLASKHAIQMLSHSKQLEYLRLKQLIAKKEREKALKKQQRMVSTCCTTPAATTTVTITTSTGCADTGVRETQPPSSADGKSLPVERTTSVTAVSGGSTRLTKDNSGQRCAVVSSANVDAVNQLADISTRKHLVSSAQQSSGQPLSQALSSLSSICPSEVHHSVISSDTVSAATDHVAESKKRSTRLDLVKKLVVQRHLRTSEKRLALARSGERVAQRSLRVLSMRLRHERSAVHQLKLQLRRLRQLTAAANQRLATRLISCRRLRQLMVAAGKRVQPSSRQRVMIENSCRRLGGQLFGSSYQLPSSPAAVNRTPKSSPLQLLPQETADQPAVYSCKPFGAALGSGAAVGSGGSCDRLWQLRDASISAVNWPAVMTSFSQLLADDDDGDDGSCGVMRFSPYRSVISDNSTRGDLLTRCVCRYHLLGRCNVTRCDCVHL